METIKKLILFFICLIIALGVLAGYYYLSLKKPPDTSKKGITKAIIYNTGYKHSDKFTKLIPGIKKYAETHNYSNQYIFLVDMTIAAGKKRFFVYDPKKDSIINSGLVTHGRCNQEWLEGRKYGNAIGCGCTSLGKYKIGNSYNGRFGKAFKLYGLDSTNSNAFNRFVVLHSHKCVPENEVDPYPMCQSDGCPTVSPGFLEKLSVYIASSKEPVLLCIYQ